MTLRVRSKRAAIGLVATLALAIAACDGPSNDTDDGTNTTDSVGEVVPDDDRDGADADPGSASSGAVVDGDELTEPDEAADPAGGESGELAGDQPDRITICHRTQGSNEYVEITISESAIDAHLNHPWGEDIIPAPPEGCPTEVDPTTTLPGSTTTEPDATTTTEPSGTTTTTSPVTTTTEPKPTTTVSGSTTTSDPPGVLPTTTTPATTLPPGSSTVPPGGSTTVPPGGSTTTIPTTSTPGSTAPPGSSTTLPSVDPTTTIPGGVLPSSSVSPPSPTTTIETGVIPGGPDELPGTGPAERRGLAAGAVLLLLIGLGLLLLARRPHTQR